jgi:elongation factor 1-gamma
LAVAKANELELEIVNVDTKAPTAEFTAANAINKIPAFAGAEDFKLSECIAIAVYFASQNEKTSLLGKTKQEYASILRWMSFFNSEVLPALARAYMPLLGNEPYNKKNVEDAFKAGEKAVSIAEAHLANATYLVGERLSLADFFAASLITRGFQYFYDVNWRMAHPHLTRWYTTIINQASYAAVAEKLEFLESPKLTNVAPKKDTPAPKKETKKEAPKPKATEEAEPAEAPKPKHPLEALPRATFPLDEFKRQYSNSETPDALKWFWENVNFDEYSIWKVDYKYNDELTLTFMSNNLIGGFNTRLEASRKYLFGCASVYGENHASVIQGAFVIRGEDYLPVFDVAPDYESYSFEKLDRTNPEHRAFLENMWSWEAPATVDGKEYTHACGKVFK